MLDVDAICSRACTPATTSASSLSSCSNPCVGIIFAESLEYLVEEAMAICLGLEGCRGAWARAGEELLRVRAQDGGTDIATAN